MQTITVSNQKGGPGKTTISVHLAMFLAEQGKRVLFIDIDPQANASKAIKHHHAVSEVMASRLFHQDVASVEAHDCITLIEADDELADLERADPKVLNQFKRNIVNLSSAFDYCVIDTPPTLGLRMTAALLVADHALAPIELEEFSIDGITKMLKTIYGVKEKWNPNLNFLGMLPNRFNSRSADQKKTFTNLVENYSHLLVRARIGIRTSIPSALASGVPVWSVKGSSAAREAGKEFHEAFNFILEKIEGVE
ncbi:ParA family protein [Vibrio parahaemolyticus]|uniref:ParA family protein n=1 Tax=Vibrio parahaemolyticus TaxID=670 RepID=UPI001E4F4216|nr:ParA family protein [Vibrio parahaemolyticus]